MISAAAALALALPVSAQDETAEAPPPGPSDIVNAAQQSEWVAIAPEDLLVMTLASDAQGKERKVVIQLMPAPFSQGWVSNIKTLARAEWYDGISVNRVQDNYVVQWGDPGHDNPESGEVETKALPEGLNTVPESTYVEPQFYGNDGGPGDLEDFDSEARTSRDPYAAMTTFWRGFLIAGSDGEAWPIHCYGMVGVGRNYSPDTGTGAELYTVIGHAPRHLDRNIALVGRIIAGMEHLSSLPRGTGALGFYTEEEASMRTPILSVRVATDLPEEERPQFEYLSTESESFVAYAEARANRRDPFFIVPAGGADICNIPVPIRASEHSGEAAE